MAQDDKNDNDKEAIKALYKSWRDEPLETNTSKSSTKESTPSVSRLRSDYEKPAEVKSTSMSKPKWNSKLSASSKVLRSPEAAKGRSKTFLKVARTRRSKSKVAANEPLTDEEQKILSEESGVPDVLSKSPSPPDTKNAKSEDNTKVDTDKTDVQQSRSEKAQSTDQTTERVDIGTGQAMLNRSSDLAGKARQRTKQLSYQTKNPGHLKHGDRSAILEQKTVHADSDSSQASTLLHREISKKSGQVPSSTYKPS